MTASNPFCTRFVRPGAIPFQFHHDRPDLEVDGCDAAANRLVRQLIERRRGLIAGPHGSGKTTLLHSIRPKLSEQFGSVSSVALSACATNRPWDRRRHARRSAAVVAAHQRDLPENGLLIVDGLEQLNPVARLGVVARASVQRHLVLATSHAAVLGFSTLMETKISIPLIRILTQSLTSQVRPEIQQQIEAELRRRDLTKLTNLRDLWFEFYELVADMEVASHRREGSTKGIAEHCESSGGK